MTLLYGQINSLNNTIRSYQEPPGNFVRVLPKLQFPEGFSLATVCAPRQSFFSRLAFAMFSCRFCFFFCSFSLASIILANFQDSTALARNSGVSAKITVVRKPYGSFAAHSTTYSAQAFMSSIFAASRKRLS